MAVDHERENRNRLENTSLKTHEIALIEELGQGKKIIPEKQGKRRIVYCEDSDDERAKGPLVGKGSRNT